MTIIERRLSSVSDLVAAALVSDSDRDALERVAERYAIALTPAIANAIDRGASSDPLALQFIPSERELQPHPRENDDPIGDRLKSPAPGIVHRYADRVLFKIASVCPVYCRFCFRREMVGPANGEALSAEEFAQAIAYIRQTPSIWEVILTGGDPLILSPRRIRETVEALSTISHVKVLRWHTRVPVVDPERISADLIDALNSSHQTVFVGLHTNHPRELTLAARSAISRLADAGLPLLSQTVLLKGVNDDADTLEALMRQLVELRVKPYYLHHGDLAPGTTHFRTTIEDGRQLMAELRRRVSGIALPTYVLDLPGAHGKVPVESGSLSDTTEGYLFRDRHGRSHHYEDACAAPDVP
ncbi:lysine-2,3-aminomutase-like protein [Hyphomicrobium sp.]|uniref:lysine-2,3-aminomutase-like protein n=1 Tax=Hyphomicrobium sp. TaxID=82 RepID=UPI000FA281EB|nr:lysine-2,3-aminomutase-like protein [Hyphomicrobium sp.]RUO97587.1 MAG: lysine-2,3-aminomutase-like protein [Hyphomicrobium sp.]